MLFVSFGSVRVVLGFVVFVVLGVFFSCAVRFRVRVVGVGYVYFFAFGMCLVEVVIRFICFGDVVAFYLLVLAFVVLGLVLLYICDFDSFL